MTARITYLSPRGVEVPEHDLEQRPQRGADIALVRDVYRRHNEGNPDPALAADLNGTLWERVAESAPEPRMCAHLIFAGTLYDQPEYCDEEALSDSEYCHRHDDGADA